MYRKWVGAASGLAGVAACLWVIGSLTGGRPAHADFSPNGRYQIVSAPEGLYLLDTQSADVWLGVTVTDKKGKPDKKWVGMTSLWSPRETK